ncbi:MAG: chondroitinase [Bacteroidia bacterium]|nr:chondroitinase [Bacteroidia bacterium]
MVKRHMITHRLFLLLACIGCSMLHAQGVKDARLFSFEEGSMPSSIEVKHSKVSLTEAHYKEGKQALKWSFKPGATLALKTPLQFEPKDPTGEDLYLSAFIVWVYNEQPQDKTVTFQFLKDGKLCTSFPFGINFKGWRAAWVCYERDMEGTPEVGMNEVRVVAPDVKGTLFFDHLITAIKVDARQQTADCQVPFVNAETTNHWLVIYKHSLLKPDLPLTAVTAEDKTDMWRIEERFREMLYTPGKLSDKEVDVIRRKYDFYGITYSKKGVVSGRPIYLVRAAEAYERMIPNWDKDMLTKQGIEMRDYFDLMKRVAVAYRNAKEEPVKTEMKRKFLAMYDHITDQGVAYGSCWGNIHHYGYSVRGLYVSYFLMKEVLAEAGKLQEAERTLCWYSIANEVYEKPLVNGIDMDSFNTQTTGRLAGILMMADTPEKLQYLQSFSRWADYGCRPAPGLSGAFKSDGSACHHRNNYPAYAVGGLEGATNIIYLLSRTRFAVSELAHRTVNNVLLTMRFYCHKLHFPLAMSGRHPNGKGKLIPIQYGMMALAGTPDGREAIDPTMAAAYLRLVSAESKSTEEPDYLPKVSGKAEQQLARLLAAKGFQPEADPQGNIALGYGCVSVQRRSNWAAVVRGHSRYLWAAEHYLGHNLYGRYLAHGSMQLLTAQPGEVVTPVTSGWREEGFDWSRIPGATAIRLPLDLLQARVLNVDAYSGMEEMLYSDEWFAGGLSQRGGNGNFGMKLHEHDKYNGSHRARKSYHFLGGTIVCLGSGIENRVADYHTETTVFQLAVADQSEKAYWEKPQKADHVWIDHLGTGYYLPVAARLEKNFPQHSRRQDSGKGTQGDWVSLVIDHGKAPQNGSYHYAVCPQSNLETMKALAAHPSYRVLQKDSRAHIVESTTEKAISYVLFETPQSELPGGLLAKADTACLVMIHREADDQLLLTVSQPDLALYRGASDEAFDAAGKRLERSIYSRPWINEESQEIPVTLTIKGRWEVAETPSCRLVSANDKETVLRFTCREAASFEVMLTQKSGR